MDEERAKEAFLGESYGGAEGGSEGWRRQGRKKAAGRPGHGGGWGRARRPGRSVSPADWGWAWGRAGRKEPQSTLETSREGEASLSDSALGPRRGRRPTAWLGGEGGEASLRRGSGRKGGRGGLPCPGASEKSLPGPGRTVAARGSRARGRPSRSLLPEGWEASAGQSEGPSGSWSEHGGSPVSALSVSGAVSLGLENRPGAHRGAPAAAVVVVVMVVVVRLRGLRWVQQRRGGLQV